jgi:NhaA family Na+:H+ antiporter
MNLKTLLASPGAAGLALAAAAVAALAAANSPWAHAYAEFTELPLRLGVGGAALPPWPLVEWVNELWMAVFFLLVGLEIKRELVAGELASRSQAVLPAVAALAGMAVPALVYAAINHADPVALRGWAIPAATDIAFAVAIVTVLGSRVPPSLKVFLTAVAIIDDLGAIVVIALFYAAQLAPAMLAGAAACMAVLALMNRGGVGRLLPYLVVGGLMWVCVLKSGVHATLAGVATALFVPLRDARGGAPAQRLEHALHPWVSFVVLPVFAFVNAGVSLHGLRAADVVAPLPLGIALGLLIGKTAGVFGSTWLLVRAGWAPRPRDASWAQLAGTSVLCGIGFTMSLFIGGLAFAGLDAGYATRVKLGVLAGSLLAGAIGSLVLVRASRSRA